MLMRSDKRIGGDFGDASSECNGEVDACERKSYSINIFRNRAMDE